MITPGAGETLSALVDGERVDPDVLERALRESGGPQALVAFVRLRERFEQEARTPGPGFYRRLPSALSGGVSARHLRKTLPLGLAAAVVVIAVGAGAFRAGQKAGGAHEATALVGVYCTDTEGSPRPVGEVRRNGDRDQECVLKAEWTPIAR